MDVNLALVGIRPLDPSRIVNEPAAAPSVAAPNGTGFTEALQGAAKGAVSQLQNAEQMSIKALSGDADIREVSDAVMSAEQSLQAAIAIRDKIVTAFLEISRMQI